MKSINTNISLTLSLIMAILFSLSAQAQLYSSGNNNISGNDVGIGTNSPDAKLHIRSSVNGGSNCLNCPPPGNDPSIILEKSVNFQNTSDQYVWEINANNDLKFELASNNNPSEEVLILKPSHSEILSSGVTVSPYVHVSSPIKNNKLYYQVALGAEYNQVSENWQSTANNGKGAVILSDKSGDLRFWTGITNSTTTEEMMVIDNAGNVGIGTKDPSSRLEVRGGNMKVRGGRFIVSAADGTKNFEVTGNGNVVAREILVDINEAIPDYVFDEDYDLMSLGDLRTYLDEESHLPNIPSAAEFEAKGGIELGDLSRRLLEKQEELTLYILQLEDRIQELETANAE